MSFLRSIVSNLDVPPTSIIGGEQVFDDQRFPWQATTTGFEKFGATLISPSVLVTSVFFLNGTSPSALNGTSSALGDVAIGCVDLEDPDCERIAVLDTFLSPDSEGFNSLGNAIGLILLAEPSTKQPIPVAAPGFVLADETPMSTLGFGQFEFNEPSDSYYYNYYDFFSPFLNVADVRSVPQDFCEHQIDALISAFFEVPFGNGPFGDPVITDSNFCTMPVKGDGCFRDDGGPLFLKCDGTGEDLLVGVNSNPIGCNTDQIPGIADKIFDQDNFNFIQSIVSLVGEDLTTVASIDQFCVDNTFPPTVEEPAPTPYPTIRSDILDVWTCDIDSWYGEDGCHCNCGAPDPDCEIQPDLVIGCDNATDTCVQGVCVAAGETASPTTSQTFNPTVAPSRSPSVETSAPTLGGFETSSPTNEVFQNETAAPTIVDLGDLELGFVILVFATVAVVTTLVIFVLGAICICCCCKEKKKDNCDTNQAKIPEEGLMVNPDQLL